eukprot:CAMPEP_0206465358 /NCGR_PEP_ID=MMETSP0324_2-20121206/27781_1 /ASSEMBLY_ACC=CAM_ASM_000836 /TAXON_ID=2866 /ORGANISM="Crypthecodinium cohnii, Strain Seligo" /LENGTH=564 /DNA_ID=CAMNT_0053938199 /DNA_START=50 /DNA_END=1744 /DNA_ORIENTATION=+
MGKQRAGTFVVAMTQRNNGARGDTFFDGTHAQQRSLSFAAARSPSPTSKFGRPSVAPAAAAATAIAAGSPDKKERKSRVGVNEKGELVASAVPNSLQSTPSQIFGDSLSPVEGKDSPDATKNGRKYPDYDEQQRAIRRADKKLGAHYYPTSPEMLNKVPESTRDTHDAVLADKLHKRRPSDASHANAHDPPVAMRHAFTDRALRLREGRGMKATLMKDDWFNTEWSESAPCLCDTCQPFESKPTGSPSHLTTHNRHMRVNKDAPPSPPPWEKAVADHFNSDWARTTMAHNMPQGNVPDFEEGQFGQTMGRKINTKPRARSPGSPHGLGILEPHSFGSSGVHKHRSMSAEAVPRPAGMYNQDYKPELMMGNTRHKAIFQAGNTGYPPRSGTALILSPRDDDPPAPTRIMKDKRGEGIFKAYCTEQSEKRILYHNQEVFRFAEPTSPKGRPAGPVALDTHAGMTTKEMSEVNFRQQPSSPKVVPRSPLLNNSRVISTLMNHEHGARLFADEVADRHTFDKAFQSVCQYTQDSKLETYSIAAELKDTIGRGQSTNVATHLVWVGAEE